MQAWRKLNAECKLNAKCKIKGVGFDITMLVGVGALDDPRQKQRNKKPLLGERWHELASDGEGSRHYIFIVTAPLSRLTPTALPGESLWFRLFL